MSEKNPELDPRLKSRLEELKPVSGRDPRRAAQTRAKFLAQVEAVQPVKRASFWAIPVRALAPAILLLILLAASAGTVFAAQTSLPGEALYPVKLFGEEVRLSWTSDPERKAELLLDYAATRVDEIVSLSLSGLPVTQPVLDRLDEQFSEAAQLAASLEDDRLARLMTRVEAQLQNEEQVLAQAQVQVQGGTGPGAQALSQAREQVQVQIALAQLGQTDPQRYRHTVRGRQESPTASPSATPTPGLPTGDPGPTTTRPGPGASGTPGPHGTQKPGNDNENGNDNGNGPGGPNPSMTPKSPGGGGGPNLTITPQPHTPGPKKTVTGGWGGKP